ncbi:STAS domain-containing protein [Solirubrobacter sp. CPCC 204708]|uniref:Anti-sigma factor antagonist n=1 Tax=Solirubrobacter deserti TaxID=2282478 RepID=A0ABT4RDU9_9ACTN|nr:STAS domain-containing protein [Solirubrobacter deserti]MBE2315962.1 STAS domain-containing protein [Solirubrobacter deserti]MDA0136713.1 STAS domain-containing protein [Solirubrobacter deserti]
MSVNPLFQVRHERRGDGVVVVASGEIDLATSPQLREALLAPDVSSASVVLDLREVTFIDSSGLGVIVGQQKRAQERREQFSVAVGGAAAVQRILELSGLAKVLDIVSDPQERLAA